MPYWYCGKLVSTVWPDQDGKVTSDNKLICKLYQRYKGENRDHCSHFSLIFKTEKIFLIFFLWECYWEKRGLTELSDHDRKYLDMKIILKGLGCKQRFLQPFLIKIPSNNQISFCFCQIEIAECWGWRIYQVTMGKWRQLKNNFYLSSKLYGWQ